MAKFNKRIERMIAELGKDQKMIDMHGVNIARREALRDRRANLCRLFLAAYRFNKKANHVDNLLLGVNAVEAGNSHDVAIYDRKDDSRNDAANNRARMVEMCNRFDNADDFMDRVREKVDILDPFYDLAYEVYSERKDKESAAELKEAERALEKARKALENAKKVAGYKKKDTLSLNHAVVKDIDKDLSPKAINQRINSCKNKKDLDDLLDNLDALGCDYDFLDDRINKKYREFAGYRVNRI